MLILGSVVLAVTGGEALYADMGHFGVRPIRLAWTFFVLPALVLGYLGQGALILRDPDGRGEPLLSRMVPAGLSTYLLVLLSSAATVIASQALISGAFSLTRQAMLLGYLPRVTIKHTAYHTEGQIYIPEVNNLLAVGCIALVLTFRESVRLAAAYGIAVTGTMAITSILYYIVVRHSWGWSKWKAGALLALFLSFDIPVPGRQSLQVLRRRLCADAHRRGLDRGHADLEPRPDRADGAILHAVFRRLEAARPLIRSLALLAGSRQAVFLAPSADHVPPILVHHVERSRSLHETVVLLTVQEMPTPGGAGRIPLPG